ncbi:hypothetical protein [Stackebrandtia nassauensis]|uniref:Uncharacterized protein n=1 Tax=Stackebrandtia nassauensis (strain DSM 44728 / CIP 108903 / NRRL B-16338 / NBRC 102104 / LLR-40K-21) TaxID=446470 RepID=D3Q3Z3_STANL|nr:hypothetical protein [Stackebrandtia nassauensis]ADD45878.1 hypothetical protein Snas_6258 [Stackebrandtia nassauensis DSM 44728]
MTATLNTDRANPATGPQVVGDDTNPKATTVPPGLGQAPPRDKITTLLRPQATPHYVVACLMASAGAAQVASEASGEPGIVAVTTASVLFVVAVLLACKKNIRLRVKNLMRDFGKGWVWTVALSIIGWLVTVAGTGISWESTATLLTAGYGLSLRWWQAKRIPNPGAPAKLAPATTAPLTYSQILTRWKATVACQGGKLPGSILTNRTVTKVGEQYLLQLVSGKQKFEDVVNAVPLIASGLRCEPSDLVPERVPGDASLVKLTILTNSPLKKPRLFTEVLDIDDGLIGLGPWADADGIASYRLYTKNSMWGGVVIGGIGSGKSEMLTGIAVSAMMRGDTLVCFADGQDGASAPELVDKAHWFAGAERAKLMLRGLAAMVQWRSRQNLRHKWKGFTPKTQGRPGILAILDECHLIFADPECQQLGEYIARVGRKVGVALLCGSQYAGIKTFGNSKPLRSAIMEGNVIALKTANKGEKHFFPNLDLDPINLPAGMPGFGYLVDVTGSGKTAPFRGRYFAEQPDDAPDDHVEPYSVTWWLNQCPDLDMDTLSITAADAVLDGGYTNRHTAVTEELDRWGAIVDAMETGQVNVNLKNLDATVTAELFDKAPTNTTMTVRFGRRLTRYLKRRPQTTSRSAAATTPAGLSTAEATVYTALATHGPMKLGQLVDKTPYEETYVRQQLTSLMKAEHIEQPKKYGPYAITHTSVAKAA